MPKWDEVWYILPLVSYNNGKVQYQIGNRTSGGTGEAYQPTPGGTAPYAISSPQPQNQDWRFFFLGDYTEGDGANWTRYEDE